MTRGRRRAAALAVLLLATACSRRHELAKAKGPVKTMMEPVRFEAASVPAYSYPFASSLRSSHVDVPRRRYAALDRKPHGEPVPQGYAPTGPARIALSPGGANALFRTRSGTFLRLDPTGAVARRSSRGIQTPVGPIALDDVAVEGGAFAWDDSPPTEENLGPDSLLLRILGSDYLLIDRVPDVPGDYPQAQRFRIERSHRRAPFAQGLVWREPVQGFPCAAAIDDAGTIIVAARNERNATIARIDVFAPQGTEMDRGVLLLKRALDFVPSELSVIPPHVALLEPRAPGTRLHGMLGDGTIEWTVEVPFAVQQPPIDGGGGRMYLAGDGLATIDHGKTVAVVSSPQPIMATAFADGSLAMATGNALQLVARTGVVEQQFETAEPIVTPPAIAANGDVWVASDEAIYVLR